MGTIIYGTKVFTKLMGYYGPNQECANCHRTYKRAIVRYSSWFHIDYIPIVPTKKQFVKMCPVCGSGFELQKAVAKQEMQAGSNGFPGFEPHAKHIMANKPKGLLAMDDSYELWLKDLSTGEDILIGSEITKEDIKNLKRERGYKKVPIEKVE